MLLLLLLLLLLVRRMLFLCGRGSFFGVVVCGCHASCLLW